MKQALKHYLWLIVIAAMTGLLVHLTFFWVPAVQSGSLGKARPAATSPVQAAGGDFTLQGPDGPVSLAALRDKVVVIYFGYTFCPDVCPTSLATIGRALSELEPKELARVQGIFVSVDPERDTKEVLKAYAPFFHPSIVGVSGMPDDLAEVARRFGAIYRKQPADADGLYAVDHSSFTDLVGPDGRLAATLRHGVPAQEVLGEIRRLLTPPTGG